MLNSETLEVGIGMAFLFLLTSLICTAVKEWIEGILKWRAMDLERAMRTLLDDHDGTTTAYLYRHPMVCSLYQGSYDPAQLTSSMMTPGAGAKHVRLSKRRNLPSYIPRESFATAFLDVVARGPVELGAEGEHGAQAPLTIEMLRERAASLASPHLRRILVAAIDHSGGNLQQPRLNIQRWFDGSMERASGWYKRRTQAVLFMLGLATAVVLNLDALHVMERLTADKSFRDVIVNEASSAKAPGAYASASQSERILQARQEIQSVGMPVGWRAVGASGSERGWVPHQLCVQPEPSVCDLAPRSAYGWLRAVTGWLVTSFAVMLGAPFWFDVLNKLMVIRSTVKPHDESPGQEAADRPARSGGGPGDVPQPAVTAPHGAASGAPATQTMASPAVFLPHQWRPGFTNPGEVQV